MTPWGEGSVIVWDGRLLEVELPPVRHRHDGPPAQTVADGDIIALRRWVSELESYFRGERLSWEYGEVDLSSRELTRFGLRTIEALMDVPAGSTVSYGTLAEMAGFPRAARAVGSVMASNGIPIVIPCHRVIRSDGSLGRYGNDSTWKERLLKHEREALGR